MLRILYVLLTSYALLACPYRCVGSSSVKCASAEPTRTCSCCDAEPNLSADVNPQDTRVPAEPCKCNCLCQGAVLSKDDVVLLTGDLSRAGLFAAALPVDLAVASGTTPDCDGRSDCTAPAGRNLRFALQSLQI